MSENTNSINDWEKLWQNYSNMLEKWKESFEMFQKATMAMQKSFNEVMEKASKESSKDTMKEFGENWQKAMNQTGLESMKAYGEMMNKFAQTWKNMWPKP